MLTLHNYCVGVAQGDHVKDSVTTKCPIEDNQSGPNFYTVFVVAPHTISCDSVSMVSDSVLVSDSVPNQVTITQIHIL